MTIPMRIASAIGALLAVVLLGVGTLLLWGNAHKDADGYLTTAHEPFAAQTYALATDNLDIDLDGADFLLDPDGLGRVRVDAEPRDGTPLFVGVARTRAVRDYLRGTPHTAVADVSYSPFRASYRERAGERQPALPADQTFWAASAQGTGTQTLTWDLQDGDWSVVVMNADASRNVAARISVGAKAPFLAPLGWALVGSGLLVLGLSGALVARSLRRRPVAAVA
jgi:hypothetical protein